jgi:hypothetical protein
MEKGKKNRSGKGGEVPEVLDVAEGRTSEADKEAGALFLGQGGFARQVFEVEKREDFPGSFRDMKEGKRTAASGHHAPELNQDEDAEIVHIGHFSEIHGQRDRSRGAEERAESAQHGPGILGIHPAREVKDQSPLAVV